MELKASLPKRVSRILLPTAPVLPKIAAVAMMEKFEFVLDMMVIVEVAIGAIYSSGRQGGRGDGPKPAEPGE